MRHDMTPQQWPEREVGGAKTPSRDTGSLTLTIPQAAALLGISTSAAYEFARKGEIPTFKLGARVLVSRKRLEEMVDGGDGADTL